MASKNAMKMKMVLLTGLAGILITLKPSSCQAQAEINPDHYEVTDRPKPAVQHSTTESRSASLKTPKAKPASRSALKSRAAHLKHSRKTIQDSQGVRAAHFAQQ